jgi:predicted small secreted protein
LSYIAKSKRKIAVFFVMVLLVSAILTGCNTREQNAGEGSSSSTPESTSSEEADNTPQENDTSLPGLQPLSGSFAENPGYTYSGTPAVPAYTVEADLGNVENRLQFTTGYIGKDWDGSDVDGFWLATSLSDEAIALIEKNGFAVSNSRSAREFFGLYEINRYGYVPSFITTDSALHSFHLVFEYVLKDLEQQKLFGALSQLSRDMVTASDAQYKALQGTTFENAALRNVAFFSVGMSLLAADFAVPDYAADLVAQELALIEAHGGIAVSPIINVGQTYADTIEAYRADYTQYIPRSHYTATPELTAFFKAMMWYGQMTFRSSHEDEVKSALLQVSALQEAQLAELWALIFEPTNFLVGECDDITWLQYGQALESIYGEKLRDVSAITESAVFADALAVIEKLPPPAINSIPIFSADLQPDRDEAITGYRFLGQRFTIDGVIMQRLMDRDTESRMLPTALDIPAAFGSEEAYAILESEGEMAAYPKLAENLSKVRDYVASVSESIWHSNVYWSWLDMLRPLADQTAGAGMPFFMQNQSWTRKELNTFAGSWTELKHDTLLYSKPPMSEMGGGGLEPPPPPDDRGYVEPNPDVFGRLANLSQAFTSGLTQRGLLTETARSALETLQYLADTCRIIAEKELENTSLTDAEYEFIRTYGGELEHIFDAVKEEEVTALMGGYYQEQYLMEHPGGLVADVATDPNGSVLQEATGFAKEIYVAFPRDGQVVLSRGLVFSHYEFTVPTAERMTDDDWHEMLNNGETPELDDWKKAFLSDTVDVAPRIIPYS